MEIYIFTSVILVNCLVFTYAYMTLIVDLTPRHHLHVDTILTELLVDVSVIPQNRIDLLHDHLTFSSTNYFIIDRIIIYTYPTKYLCRQLVCPLSTHRLSA